MSINLTDEIEVKTKKGKLGAAKQIFLKGDMQTVEQEIQDINSRHNTLNNKHESLSKTVQGIAATGGASTANNVTYNNDNSGLNAENAQDAIDELQGSKINKTSILQESGDDENSVMSQKATTTAIANEVARAKAAEEAIIFDVSANNNDAVFESLQALLSSSNLSTLIPTSVRHGGMSIRFIHSSDNKYVQYRLMTTSFSSVESDWQGVDDVPTVGSDNLVKSGGVKTNILEEQNNIFATLEGKGLFIPLKTDYYNNLTILNNNKWYQQITMGNCYIAPVPVGLSKLRVTANDNTDSLIALLKSDAHENGTIVDYAEEWTYNDGVIQKGTTVEISLPNDCNYIYIAASLNSSSTTDDRMPSSIEMIASIREDVNALKSNFSTLAGTVVLHGTNINDLNNTTVKTTTQSFTNVQKGQARTNIGAIDITGAKTLVEDAIANFSEKVEGENKFIPGQSGHYSQNGVWRDYLAHTFFDVSEGDVFRLYNWQTADGVTKYMSVKQATICAFDKNNVAVSDKGATNVSSYIVPEGITRICFGVNNAIATKPCVTLNQETPPTVETPYVAPRNVVITDSTLTDEKLPANSKAVGDALALKMNIDNFAVRPKNIKNIYNIEDYSSTTILTGRCVSSIKNVDGVNYLTWIDTDDYYTIAINIRQYKDMTLVSDILPQNVISKFLVVGVDNGLDDIQYVSWTDSDGTFSQAPNAYANDGTKMTLNINSFFNTWHYKGNIVLYIKMPVTYKINWAVSGKALAKYDWMDIGSYAKTALKKELKEDNIKIVLPSKIYCAVGNEMNIYYESAILCDDIGRYGFVTSMGSLSDKHRENNERIKLCPTSASNGINCSISVIDKLTLDTVATKAFTVVTSVVSQPNKKVVFIGDSLTDRCIYPAEICQVLGGGNIVSLGTKHDTLAYEGSNGTVNVDMDNEGRGGWSAIDYCTKTTNDGNAFWNPANEKFDFSYYMTENNFDSVDCVVIALGTNDVGKPMLNANFDAIINSFKTMIDSVHAYDSNIKVIVSLTPHGAEPDGWAATGYSDRSTVYNYLQMKLVEKLIENFENVANVFLAPTYLNIDHHNDFPTKEVTISTRNPKIVNRQSNNVHFSDDTTNPVSQCWGYLKMADAIWYTMLAAFS